MPLPRPVVPGRTLAITKRCVLRKYLLKPSRRVDQVVRHALAEAATKYGVKVHAVIVMSNHVHLLITDERGEYPLFLHRFHLHVAKALNCLYGRWGCFWDPTQTSVTEVVGAAAALAWAVYILCNPVRANLVHKANAWPGVSSWAATVHGRRLGAKRPRWFYDPRGEVAEEAWVEVTPPPAFEGTVSEWRALVARKVAEREEQLAKKRSGRVLGRKAVLAQSREASPTTPEERRQPVKRVAGDAKWPRIEAVGQRLDWLAAYKAALQQLRAGVLDVVFPAYTWAMARLGLRVAPA